MWHPVIKKKLFKIYKWPPHLLPLLSFSHLLIPSMLGVTAIAVACMRAAGCTRSTRWGRRRLSRSPASAPTRLPPRSTSPAWIRRCWGLGGGCRCGTRWTCSSPTTGSTRTTHSSRGSSVLACSTMSSLLTPSTAATIASRSPSTATSAGLPNLDAYESFAVIDGLKPKNVRAFVDLVFARQLLVSNQYLTPHPQSPLIKSCSRFCQFSTTKRIVNLDSGRGGAADDPGRVCGGEAPRGTEQVRGTCFGWASTRHMIPTRRWPGTLAMHQDTNWLRLYSYVNNFTALVFSVHASQIAKRCFF